jgi:L-histidine Nalpha-methyltransferase
MQEGDFALEVILAPCACIGFCVVPVAADFTHPFDLPRSLGPHHLAGFFPGSTIGNFEPDAARELLLLARRLLRSGATFVVGVDLVKERLRALR